MSANSTATTTQGTTGIVFIGEDLPPRSRAALALRVRLSGKFSREPDLERRMMLLGLVLRADSLFNRFESRRDARRQS